MAVIYDGLNPVAWFDEDLVDPFATPPVDTTPPLVDVETPLTVKMSNNAGYNSYSYQFSPNEALQAWKIKLVPAAHSIESAGTLIESGGAVAANADVTGSITYAELIAAGGSAGHNIVKVFGQDLAGNWSQGTTEGFSFSPSNTIGPATLIGPTL